MTKFKAIVCSLGLAGLLLGGCGGDPVKDMEAIAKEMCECKDAECVKGVNKKMEDLAKKYGDKKEEPSAEDQKKLMAAAMKMAECQQKIMAGGGGEEKKDEGGEKKEGE